MIRLSDEEEIEIKQRRMNWQQRIQQSWEDDREELEQAFSLADDIVKKLRKLREEEEGG